MLLNLLQLLRQLKSLNIKLINQTMNEEPNIKGSSPEPDQPEVKQLEESFDFLVSKHLIPPPLMLLPKPVSHKPKSLLPMIPLPPFIGIIPNFQPLDKPITLPLVQNDFIFSWIGEAFDNIVYRKYDQESYKKIDNVDQNWNIWACDINKVNARKTSEEAAAPQPTLLPFYNPKNHKDKTLVFESRFQCGNLSLVSKVTDCQYNLLLQNDINTNGYSQWFFFKVSNVFKDQQVKFKILNQYKMNNLYKMGMKIIIYSKRQSEQKNLSWHRGGQNIEYYENGYSKNSTECKPFFTLSWDYTFLYDKDDVYFAYSYPYTYSNLENFFFKVESDTHLRKICSRSALCKTVAGNRVDILTITEDHPQQQLQKGYIVITARIHPGESVSSYVCNGIIQFLLSNDQKAKRLRQNFIFKIVPMINPDGVIHGNYRSNISGYDLNKKWENPSKIYHPEIFYLKKLILSIQEEGDILLFCDLHGHSMKKNAFVYGCHDSSDPRKGKEFPLLMSKIFKGFSFKDCSFLDKDEEQGTSRTYLSKELKHCDIYALESSFCGPEYENIHFTVRHFEELGQKFCETLLIYFQDKIKQMHVEAAMRQKSYFPNQNDSYDSLPELEGLNIIEQLDLTEFTDRVNSENSQLSQNEEESQIILQDKIVKKYLLMRYMRPTADALKRNNILVRKSHSKQTTKMKLSDFLYNGSNINAKSNSPIKKREGDLAGNSPIRRKELYESPVKVDKPKIILKLAFEKKQIQQKLFQPIDIVTTFEKRNKSVGKLGYQSQKTIKPSEKSTVKIVLNKNYEFKQREEEPIFKNTSLKALSREQAKNDKKINDFIIRKKVPYADDKNTINLFNSVLCSLRKDRK